MPSVPSDPISNCLRSKPRLSFLSGVSWEKTCPSASTASSPSTRARIDPWRSTCEPPALVEISPPTVAEPLPPSVNGKRRSCASALSWSVWRIRPASHVARPDSVSISRIAFMRRSERSSAVPLSSGVAPPDMPELPPWGTIGTPCSAQRRTRADTSSTLAGEARAQARPVKRPRQSVSQGATSSGSVVRPRGPSRAAASFRKPAGAVSFILAIWHMLHGVSSPTRDNCEGGSGARWRTS